MKCYPGPKEKLRVIHHKIQLFLSLSFFSVCLFSVSELSAQISQVGDKIFSLKVENNQVKIPYYANQDIDQGDEKYNRVVVVVHGTNRNADEYFENMMMAADQRPNLTDSTLIIAPQFIIQDDLQPNSLDREYLYWTNGGWRTGSLSRDEAPDRRLVRISSFAVLDSLLERLVQNFPNVKSIVFTGHSAGGQLTNRFSASSRIADVLCREYGVGMKFIVSNPGSYVYMDAKRRRSGTEDEFRLPTANCDGYNEWRYGLEDLFSYPSMAGADSIRSMMARREIVYLLGELDNDPNTSSLDVSCAGRLQGLHRLNRGSIYYNHLIDHFGSDISQKQSIDTVPNVGHDNFGIYNSEKGLLHLFEIPVQDCKQDPIITSTNDIQPAKYHIYPNPTSGSLFIENANDLDQMTIHDLSGKQIRIIYSSGQHLIQLNIESLPVGTYLLKLSDGTQNQLELITKF